MNVQITELLSNNFTILVGQALASILALLLERVLVVPKSHMKMWGIKIAMMHFCIISFFYYVLLLLTGKVIFTVVMVLSLLLILIVINNAKYKNLQEPLVFSDYDYFTDAFRFPRLYIPFLGVPGFFGIVIGVLLIILGYIQDSSVIDRFHLDKGLGLSVIWLLLCVLFLQCNIRTSKLATFNPKEDVNNLGFVVYMWSYFIEYLKKPYPISKYEYMALKKSKNGDKVLPHLVAIQSESFFDPRDWNCNIKKEVLETFDVVCSEAWRSGKLSVPAFGANTIRTEFSFLTSITPSSMKGHQFSPYQIMSRKSFELKSFVNLLKSQGYYTVCVHPYYKKFYHRDVIFNKWGFDKFLDIDSFSKTENKGAYISDEAITKKILSILKLEIDMPIFIFAITMENHGPMHLEKITDVEGKQFYKQDDKKLVDYDLSVYLNHLHNADKMLKDLTIAFNNSNYPISMAFYGDHIPIMPNAYKNIGIPSGKVPYFIWDNKAFVNAFGNNDTNLSEDNKNNQKSLNVDLKIEDLSVAWLSRVNLD